MGKKNTFDKIQYPFMIKALKKVGIEGSQNVIKAKCNIPTVNIYWVWIN
jgi:hypothetical protein